MGKPIIGSTYNDALRQKAQKKTDKKIQQQQKKQNTGKTAQKRNANPSPVVNRNNRNTNTTRRRNGATTPGPVKRNGSQRQNKTKKQQQRQLAANDAAAAKKKNKNNARNSAAPAPLANKSGYKNKSKNNQPQINQRAREGIISKTGAVLPKSALQPSTKKNRSSGGFSSKTGTENIIKQTGIQVQNKRDALKQAYKTDDGKLRAMLGVSGAWGDTSNSKSDKDMLHAINIANMNELNKSIRKSMKQQYGDMYNWDTYEPVTYDSHTGDYTLNYTGTASQNADGTWTYSGGKKLSQIGQQGASNPLKHQSDRDIAKGLTGKAKMGAEEVSKAANRNAWLSQQDNQVIQKAAEGQDKYSHTQQLKQAYEKQTGKNWDEKTKIGKTLYGTKAAVSQGLYKANQGIMQTVDFFAPTELLFGENNAFDKWLDDWYGDNSEHAQQFQNQYDLAYNTSGDAGKLGMWTTSLLTENLPQTIVAIATAGASAVPSLAADGGNMLLSSLQRVIKNPSFWTSFAQIAGNSYNDAKSNGADDLTATAHAFTTSFLQSMIEIDSGLETLNRQETAETLGQLFRQTVKTAWEEGGEEVQQDMIDHLLQMGFYDPNKTLFSTTDDNALINPVRAAENFAGGAVVGGIMGGGSQALAYGANARYRNAMADTQNNTDVQEDASSAGGAMPESGTVRQAETQQRQTGTVQRAQNAGQNSETDEVSKHIQDTKKAAGEAVKSQTAQAGGKVIEAAQAQLSGEKEAVLRALGNAGTEDFVKNDMQQAEASEQAAYAAAYASGVQSSGTAQAKAAAVSTAAESIGETRAAAAFDAGVQDRAQVEQQSTAAAMEQSFDSAGREAYKEYQNTESAQNDPEAYFEAFTRYYNAGLTNTLDRVESSSWAKMISQQAASAAYEAGMQDASQRVQIQRDIADGAAVSAKIGTVVYESDSSDISGEVQNRLSYYASKLNTRIVVKDSVEGGTKNGAIVGDTIYLAKDAEGDTLEQALTLTASHEITHRMQTYAPEKYRTFRDYALRQKAEGNADGMEQLISETIDKYAKNGIPLTRQEAMDEIAADYAANELMTDPESIQAFVNSKPKAARSFWQKLRNAFKQLRKKIDGTSAAEKKILRRMSTAERLWADAFQAASERANGVQQTSSQRVKTKAHKPETTKSLTEKSRKNMRYSAKKKTADGGSLYDYTKSFAQQIDDWMKGKIPKSDSLLIGKTPVIFRKIGFNALPMTINQTHVDYAINGTKNADHMVGVDGLKQLPQALEHPVAVIASKTQGGTSVVALLPFTHSGNTVIAPVVIDGFARQNNVLIDSNAVTSVHGRKNAVTRLLAGALDDYASGETSLFYWDKEKATTLLRKARVTMPKSSVQIHSGYIASIRDADSPVKPKMENVTESVQFKRWFGNWMENPEKASKIVNADGSPKIMYHQTDADFSVFRTESTGAGRGDAILPDGAFFKSSDTDIGVSGQKQMRVYLNVRNPLRLKDRASAQAYWEKHVAGYKELMQESQRTDALYNMRMEQTEVEEDAQYAKLWQQWRNGEISEKQYQSGIEEDASEKILQEWKQEEQRITQRAKQLLNDYMHNSKYDGIILSQDEGSFGRSTDSVIAFSPNQVKSATDNVGTFDRENADIRYSAKPRSAESYESEIERLKKQRDEAKRQIKLSEYQQVSPAGIKRMAQDLLAEYRSTANAEELTDTLQTLYDILHKRPELIDTDGAYNFAESAAELILDDATVMETEMSETYADLLSDLKRNAISVPRENRGDFADGWSSFKKQNRKYVQLTNSGTPIDEKYTELSEQYPSLFPAEVVNPADQAELLAETARTFAPVERSLTDEEYSAATDVIAQGIIDRFKETASLEPTYADRQKIRFDELNENTKQQISQLKQQQKRELDKLRADMLRSGENYRQDSLQVQREKYEQKISDIQQQIADLKKKNREDVRKAVAQSDARRAAAAENRELKKMNAPSLQELGIERHKHLAETEQRVGEYGAIEPGENPVRNVTLPQSTDGHTRVRRFYRTTAEAGQTSGRMVTELEKDVLNNAAASYTVESNSKSIERAKARLASGMDGMQQWEAVANSDRIPSAADVAMGELMLDQALKNDDTEAALKITEQLAYIGTRAGQVVQAMRILKKLSGVSQIKYVTRAKNQLQADLNARFGTKAPNLEIPQDLQARLMKATTEAEKENVMEEIYQNFAEQLPVTWADKWNAWRYFSMLANPRTHIRNVLGNAVFVPAVHVKNVTAAMIEAGASRIYHARTGNVMERTKTLRASVPNAARKAARRAAAAEYKTQKDIVQGGGKYNPADQIRDKQRVFKSRLINTLMKGNDAALEGEDGLFLRYHYVNAMANYLLANNLTEQDLYDANGVETKHLLHARSIALQEAQRNTYRDASALATWLNKLSRQNKAAELIVEGLFPFKKTPVNILKRGIEYSPAGLITASVQAAKDLRAGRINAAQYIDRLSAGLTGGGIALLGIALASREMLRAGSSGDDDKDKYEEYALGYQDFSLQIGNHSYTIDWMAPAVMPLMVGVEVYNALTQEGYSTSDILNSFALVAEPMLSLSMLDGLQSTLQSISSEDGNQLANFSASAISSYVTQGIPTLFGQIARIQQGGSKTVYTDPDSWMPTYLQKIIYKARNKVPAIPQAIVGDNKWLQWYNDHCTIAAGQDWVNTWGVVDQSKNVLYNILANMVSPGYYSKIQVGETDKEILRLYQEYGDTAVLPNLPQKRLTIKDADGISQTVILNADQYTQIKKDYGSMAYDLLKKLVNDENYKSVSDEDKLEMIDKVYEYALAICKNNIDSRHALTSTQQKIKDSGINPARAIAAKNRIDAFENDDSLTQKEIRQKQREYISSLSGFSPAQKKALDKIAVSAGTFIPDDTDIDYSNAETFQISGMSDAAQEKWAQAKQNGWDAKRYKELYTIVHSSKGGKKEEKLATAKKSGFTESEFNYIWKLAYNRKK